MGIRMELGAAASDVVAMVLRSSVSVSAAWRSGSSGPSGSESASPGIAPGVEATDPWSLVTSALILLMLQERDGASSRPKTRSATISDT